MVENPVNLTRESPLTPHLSRFMGLSHKPTSNFGYLTRIPANPVQTTAFRSSSSRTYQNPIALSSFKELGRSNIGFRQLGCDWFRVSSVSNDGSDGTGGYSGGSSDGSSGGDGGGGGDGGERKWSLLSW